MEELEMYDDYVIEGEYDEVDEDYDEAEYDEEEYYIDDDEDDDDVLEALIDDYGDDPADTAEFLRWFRKKKKKKKLLTAKGVNAFKANFTKRFVTQPQLRTSLGKVRVEVRRNAAGVKQVNRAVGAVSRRVSANSRVNRIQSRQLAKMQKMQKAIGVMEFVEAYDPETRSIDTFQLLRGAVATGMLGSGKGTMHNPYLLGALGLILRNNDGDLGGLLGGGNG